MNRSVWKPIINYLSENMCFKGKQYEVIRRGCVLREHVGLKINVHYGLKNVFECKVKFKMIGFKYGQLVLTKKQVKHKIKLKAKLKKKN